MDSLDDGAIVFEEKPRSVWVALVVSLLLPGLGQIYNGQPKKTAVYFALLASVIGVFWFFEWAHYFEGLVVLCLFELVWRVSILLDAAIWAKKQQEYKLKNFNKLHFYVVSGLAILAVLFSLSFSVALGLTTFHIPSPSNCPTIQVDDRLVADMRAYYKTEVGYGDIVVFNAPSGEIWTFRVVGLPLDTIEVVGNRVIVNNKKSEEKSIATTEHDDGLVGEFQQQLPNGHAHHIYKNLGRGSIKSDWPQTVVPEFSYFVLGDNRDNAADSRYIGFVKEEDILGRVLYTYWGENQARINIDFREK